MPVSVCALLLLQLSLPWARIGKSLSGKERASAPAPPRFPGDAKIWAPGVHRSHCRQASSLSLPSSVVQNSTGSRKNSKVVVGGTSPTETSPFPTIVRVFLRLAIPHFHLDWSELGINTFECVSDLSAYSLLSTPNPRLFWCLHCGFVPRII